MKAHDEEACRRKATQKQTVQVHFHQFLRYFANSHVDAHLREAL